MDADHHAIAFLAVYPLAVVLLARFGFRPQTWREWGMALLRGLGTFLLVMIVVTVSDTHLCGPTPSFQYELPAMVAGMCAATARTRTVRIVLAGLFLVIAILLVDQYRMLLKTSPDAYAGWDGMDSYMTCGKPATKAELWHTWFTGIFGLVPK